jgi:hypothetical protein
MDSRTFAGLEWVVNVALVLAAIGVFALLLLGVAAVFGGCWFARNYTIVARAKQD